MHDLKELKISILSHLFKIINFLTNDEDICQRFITINFHALLIKEILFKNNFTQSQSRDLAFSICHLIDFHLSQNKDVDFIQGFFGEFPIASFLNQNIDIIDQINFLVIFSKYSLNPEFAYEIISMILKITLIEEMAPQLSWFMLYIMQSNINNIDLLFNHPLIQKNEGNNLFYKVSSFLESDIVDESFYIPYLKFCIRSLRQLECINQYYQIIVQYHVHSKILDNFDLSYASCEFLELYIRFLNLIFKYDENFFSEDLILFIINLGIDSKFFVVNQIMIFLSKVIPISSVEFVATIFRSEFFFDCLDSINSGIDIIVLSKLIFLIYEKIEAIPDLFDEYVTINSDHETVEAFNIAVESITIKNSQKLEILYDYWGKMQNAISLLESDENNE